MRNYPQLTEQNTTRDFIETFGGLNRNIRISDGEFADMKNLTSDYYPTLATRPKRGCMSANLTLSDYDFKIVGTIAKEDLYSIITMKHPSEENKCTYCVRIGNGSDGRVVNFGVTEWYPYQYDAPRKLVSMGAYIIVFPEGFYFNTIKTDENGNLREFGLIQKDYSPPTYYDVAHGVHSYADFQPCDNEGRVMNIRGTFGENERSTFLNGKVESGENKDVSGPVNGSYYLDTTTGSFYYWLTSSESWMTATPQLRISIDNSVSGVPGLYDDDLTKHFKVGDGIRIRNLKVPKTDELDVEWKGLFNNSDIIDVVFKGCEKKSTGEITITHNIKEESGEPLTKDIVYECFEIDRPFTIIAIEKGYMVLDFKPNFTMVEAKTLHRIRFSTLTPKMDYVIESGNRLWGCRYGKNNNGDIVNEIYASKLGDFKNWESFLGVATDSYSLSLGSDGEFTGAATYLGLPVFFKQNCLHTIYGSFPAQYQLQTTECRGVQKGCEKSLIVLDGALLYKAVGGVCAYTGSLPAEIGSQLNEKGIQFTEAIAGTYHHKYYLAMKDSEKNDGKHWLYVYDTNKGVWHKESPIDVVQFCEVSAAGKDDLYYHNDSSLDMHQIIGNNETTNEDKVGWYAETGIMGCSSPDKKYISRLSLRLSMGIGTRVYVSAEYDSSGVWEQIAVIVGSRLGTFTIPIRPKRCDHLRLRLEGDDEVKIYSISKTMEQGSDV